MADRKKTPDILGSLLGDASMPEYHNTGIPEYHNDSKPELQPTSKPVRKPTGKTVSHKKPEAQEPAEKVKATFYLDAGIVEALEEGWMELRKLADKKDRGQISKSLIVELALKMALDELKAQGVKSLLAKNSVENDRK